MDFYTVLSRSVGDYFMVKQSFANVSYSQPFGLSSRCLSPKSSSRFNVPSRTFGIASVTTLATIGLLYVSYPASTYEGNIQLVGILPTPPSNILPPEGAGVPLHPIILPSLSEANIAPPELINAIDNEVVRNPAMVTTVIQNLNNQGISIHPSTFLNHLSAETSSEGWLELTYEDTEIERVERILAEVAQWYESQESNCDIQACDDAMFIESQLPVLEQRQQELEQEISTLHQSTHSFAQQPATQEPITTIQLDAHVQNLLVQQHEQIQHIARVETRMDELLAQLEQYQAQMHLSHVTPKTGVVLLRQITPEYDAWLNRWKEGDRQLVTFTLARQIDGNLSTINVLRPSDQSLSLHMEHLLTKHHHLHDEMKRTVHELVHQPLANMPMPIRELIVEDVARFEPMERWLLTLHRLHLLESRRQTLEDIQQETTIQVQEWQEAIAVQAQLQRELDIVNGTLSAYRDRYSVAQHQAAQAELTWQVIAPPEIVQQPQEWAWDWANILPKPSLVTLH